MASIFDKLGSLIGKYTMKQIKMKSMSTAQLKELATLQGEYLEDIIASLEVFSASDLDALRTKYLNMPSTKETYNCRSIILDMKRDLNGKAGLHERQGAFMAALKTAKTLKKIMDELNKNAGRMLDSGKLTFENTRITDVMLYGILKESDIFIKYTSFLWEYFRSTLDSQPYNKMYRAKYLLDNKEAYFRIITNICDERSNYSFLADVDVIKRKQADLLLNAGGTSFLSFLDRRKYNKSNEEHVSFGIVGFNFIARLVEYWDNWKYRQHQRKKMHKEWLQHESFRLQEILHGQDPNSESALQTKKYLEAYSDAITKIDAELSEYEGANDETVY